MIRFLTFLITVSLALLYVPLLAADLLPVGSEFLINSAYTSNDQSSPAIGVGPDGQYVVVWDSLGSDGGDNSGLSVRARQYDPDGQASGAEFQVNSYGALNQQDPEVAFSPDGSFVIVWQGYHQTGLGDFDGDGIHARFYASDGTPTGGEIGVNAYDDGNQMTPAVTSLPSGGFAISWVSDNGAVDNSGDSVQARLLASNGTPVGDQFLVNTYTTDSQTRPDVAAFANGDFIVVWDSWENGWKGDPHGQIFASNGSTIGSELALNTDLDQEDWDSEVVVLPDDRFVVAWKSRAQGSASWNAFARFFSSDGTPEGAEFQVSDNHTYAGVDPTIALGAHGEFVVAWETSLQDGDLAGVAVRRYDSSGNQAGAELVVNTYTTSNQDEPAVAFLGAGQYLVVWSSNGSNGLGTDGRAVLGRQVLNPTVFVDGFESGTTAEWSSAVVSR